MSVTSAIIPFYIRDAAAGTARVATQEEFDQYKTNPKNKPTITKWVKANRTALARRYMSEGDDTNVAWAKAFQEYPEQDNKPRFFIK